MEDKENKKNENATPPPEPKLPQKIICETFSKKNSKSKESK